MPVLEEPEQTVRERGGLVGNLDREVAIEEGFKEPLVLRGKFGYRSGPFLCSVSFARGHQQCHEGNHGNRILLGVLVP